MGSAGHSLDAYNVSGTSPNRPPCRPSSVPPWSEHPCARTAVRFRGYIHVPRFYRAHAGAAEDPHRDQEAEDRAAPRNTGGCRVFGSVCRAT